jgi:hypothetical protein
MQSLSAPASYCPVAKTGKALREAGVANAHKMLLMRFVEPTN